MPHGGRPGKLEVRRAYRPCLLTWLGCEPTDESIECMRRAVLALDRRSLLVPLDAATQLMLLAEESGEPASEDRAGDAVRSVLAVAHAVRPDARIQAVVGERIAPGERLGSGAARLRRLARRPTAGPGDEVIWARRPSLASLFGTLDPRAAAAFVEERLAGLRSYDREHGTDLQRVLELALDHPDRNTAASRAFMHRNTFRRQLRRALDLAGVDLADPDERLALHIALKLRWGRGRPGARFGRAQAGRRPD